jgi:ubiquinone/menaquinone biosynthesis C-methylase UbiE
MRGKALLTLAALALTTIAVGGLIVARLNAVRTRREAARLADVLGVGEGDRIADVGAGNGAYALELARRVGPTGHVVATESDRKQRRRIESSIAKARLRHVSVVEAGEAHTGLERNCCDAMFLRGVYHHFTQPAETNAGLREALRPSGRLVVIDRQALRCGNGQRSTVNRRPVSLSFSARDPQCPNLKPEPGTNPVTVCVTRTSPGRA